MYPCLFVFFCSELPWVPRYILVLGSNVAAVPQLSGLSWWLLLLLVFLRSPSWNPLPSCSMNLASFAALFVGGCSPVWVFPHLCSELHHLSSESCFVWLVGFTPFLRDWGGGYCFPGQDSQVNLEKGHHKVKYLEPCMSENVFIPPHHTYLEAGLDIGMQNDSFFTRCWSRNVHCPVRCMCHPCAISQQLDLWGFPLRSS